MAAVAASAAAAIAMTAAIAPALAAPRPTAEHAARPRAAAHGKTSDRAKTTASYGKLAQAVPHVITTQLGGGKYVTVVRCTGSVSTPPPVQLARRDDPLTVVGHHPTAAVVKLLSKPKAYKTVYTCTVIVEVKVPVVKKKTHPSRPSHPGKEGGKGGCAAGTVGGGTGKGHGCHRVIIVNTGFGGEAGTVAGHHPAS